MNRIRFKNIYVKRIVHIMIIIVISYVYLFMLSIDKVKNIIKNNVFIKYNNNIFKISKDKIVYTSLNKIVDYSDILKINDSDSVEVKNDIEVINKIENNKVSNNKIVYIYNTHDTEKYKSLFISDYSITPNVKLASYILKDYLNDLGIESFVQNKSISSYLKKHNLDYKGSYEASRVYMKEELKNNDYKILIDLHRDSSKYKYTLYTKDKKKYAKIMFVLTMKHKNYKKNEKFANNLNNRINKKYKGLSRGIMKRKDVIFNQDLSDNAILIELGGVDNTLEEVNNTLKVLSEILYDYIKEEL